MNKELLQERKKMIYEFVCDDLYVPMKAKEMAVVLNVPKSQRGELIEVLDDSYRSITDKSKKAAIENNRMNEMFLERLKTIGYISSYREDDDKLRVSHKRNH